MKDALITHLAIVAGGTGSRLSREFGDTAKSLVPVGGKPVLQHQLEWAATFGVKTVTIFAGHLARQIVAFVGDGRRFGLDVRVEVEDRALGTAGALLRRLDALPENFLAIYGDVLSAVDLHRLADAHHAAGADFSVVAHPNDHPMDSDLLETDGSGFVTAIHNYPHPEGARFNNLVNAALYVVRREALRLETLKDKKCDFARDVLPLLISGGARVLAYRSSEYIKDMGTPARLSEVASDVLEGKLDRARRSAGCPAVFLDRDGTLNIEKGHLASPDELELEDGVAEALRALRHAGFRLVVLTNQPVIARGEASEDDVAAIHRRLEWELGKQGAYLDAIYFCPHHPDSGFAGERPELKIACDCRKPDTAMVRRACRDLSLDLTSSWMVGDRSVDMELARRAGLRSVLLQTGKAGGDDKFDAAPGFVAKSIGDAAALIVSTRAAAAR